MKNLVNMKMSKDQQKDMVSDFKPPEYPYGLRISLDEDALKKLGVEQMPEVGHECVIVCRVTVSDASQYESLEGGSRRSMSLQITDMALEEEKKQSPAEKLYPVKA